VMAEWVWNKTEEGTPQGGIISPMLCNVALNSLEKVIKSVGKRSSTGHSPLIKVVRYADDVVITGKDEKILEECKEKMKEFLKVRGLTLNENKTRIVNIEEGIDFLGFNIRRQSWNWFKNAVTTQKDVLVIKPSKKGIINLQRKISEIIKKFKNITDIANGLNPVLRGWAEHKRISPQARQSFFRIDNYIWERLRTQLIRSKVGRIRVRENFLKVSNGKGVWGDKNGVKILSLARVGIHRLRLKKLDLNPYIPENLQYFLDQQAKRVISNLRLKVYAKHNQKCYVCDDTLHNGERVEIHHIKAVKDGGTNKLSNLVALHRICHDKTTHEKLDQSNQTKTK
jgi:RNA-directed DNA polymerase